MMTEQQFNDYFVNRILDYLPDSMQSAKVRVTPTVKNNGVVLQGVSFLLPGKSYCASPTFYLEELYHDIQGGKTVQDVMIGVAYDYMDAMEHMLPIEQMNIDTFEAVENKVFFQLVNLKANREMLKTHPHQQVMNLAKIYFIEPLPDMMIKVSYDLMEQWGISQKQLDTVAMKNMSEQKEPLLTPVFESLLNPITKCNNYLHEDKLPKDIFYTLSNTEGCFGAAAAIYPGVMEKTAELIGENFYLMPSSVHEMIILPECKIPPKELGRMVREANLTVVSDKDMLADCIYKYDRKEKSLQIVPDSMAKNKEYER